MCQCSGHLHQINLDGLLISDFERDAPHRETLRTQGVLTSRFGYDARGRKAWQAAIQLPHERLKGLGRYLTGGGQQVEMTIPGPDRMKYLRIVDEYPIK